MSTWGGQVESMSHMSWVGTVASLRTDASTTAVSQLQPLLPSVINFSREAGNLDFHPQPSDFSIFENTNTTNTFLKWAGH